MNSIAIFCSVDNSSVWIITHHHYLHHLAAFPLSFAIHPSSDTSPESLTSSWWQRRGVSVQTIYKYSCSSILHCVWWSQVELIWWHFPLCNLCIWPPRKIANPHTCMCLLTKRSHICHFHHAGHESQVAFLWGTGVGVVAYGDNNTIAGV